MNPSQPSPILPTAQRRIPLDIMATPIITTLTQEADRIVEEGLVEEYPEEYPNEEVAVRLEVEAGIEAVMEVAVEVMAQVADNSIHAIAVENRVTGRKTVSNSY